MAPAPLRSAAVPGVLRVPPRPRSFRFSPDDLERLHAPAWRRWLGRIGAPRFDLVRPLATAVAGIGLAVVVLGSALPGAGPGVFFQAAGAPSAGARARRRGCRAGRPEGHRAVEPERATVDPRRAHRRGPPRIRPCTRRPGHPRPPRPRAPAPPA